MAGSAGNRRPQNENNINRRRRRERRADGNRSSGSDEENVEPTPLGNQRDRIQEGLRRIQRNMQAIEREYAEQSELARTSSDDLVEKFKEVMEPETDYDTDALMFSETESESSSSNSSILTDSSELSSEEEGERKTEANDIPKKKKKKNKKNETYDCEDYAELQYRMDQLYTPKPDIPESEISQGLLCVTKWNNKWVRVLVQSYNPTTSLAQVGSLDYGAHFEVHKSDIKPILRDLSAEYSIPYRCAQEKKKPEDMSPPVHGKRKNVDESGNEIPLKKSKEVKESERDIETPATNVEEIHDLKNEKEDPIPSTSSQSVGNEDLDAEENKRYKKSFSYLQHQWCKQQPDFVKLRQDLTEKHDSLSPEGADAFAFLEYTEKIEMEEQLVRATKISSIKAKFAIKKENLKKKSKTKYKKKLEELKNKQWKWIKLMDINHERDQRKIYLMGAEDEKFTKEEWKNKQ